jgi:uncharacterized protein (TIGR04255 family)
MSAIAAELFPPIDRVIYDKSPLVEVVCQLKFPSVLRVESAAPAEFQERIRNIFPIFERGSSIGFPSLPQNLPPQIAQLLGQQNGPTYMFLTEDRQTFLSLGADSICLTTKAYKRWEQFLGQLQPPLKALSEIYQPSFFGRVGLRYTDGIERKPLNLVECKWSELLRKEILGEIALPQFEDCLEDVQRIIRLKFHDGNGSILLRHGLGQVLGHAEICYMIDLDFFTDQKVEVTDAESILNRFNSRAGRAFRWCITQRLHDALGPTAIVD